MTLIYLVEISHGGSEVKEADKGKWKKKETNHEKTSCNVENFMFLWAMTQMLRFLS
jgi:hypothetical protein